MSIVTPTLRIASAYAVTCGHYGDVTRCARQRCVCRQRIYHEAAGVQATLAGTAGPPEIDRLRQQVRVQEDRLAELQRRLDQAVLLDRDKQAEFASVGQALGVSLPALHTLLEVLLPGQAPSVATLGRWTQAAGQKAGALLAVLDEYTREPVTQAVADEIYVSQPVLMVVEPESLCWLSGRLTEPVNGTAWAQELSPFARLEQVTRDAGSSLSKGMVELNRQRQEQGLAPVADQLDHWHTLREGGQSVGRAERAARRAWAALERAEATYAECQRQGQPLTVSSNRVRACWPKVEKALEVWQERERVWQQTTAAVQLFTPEGELNTRARAEALLAETLPHLPDEEFGTVKRLLQRSETLTYLDEVQRKLAALPVPAAVRQAAVRQAAVRRRPEVLQGDTPQAAALRGVLLVCAVVLAKAGIVGQQAVQGVRSVLRSSWRASSLVECVNSVLRMQQARHRKLSQGLLDLKRLYWNCHRFRTGRRRSQSPYQRLGVAWPEGVGWWEVLKWPPERLRNEVSTLKKAG
jgi:hypothetical protein